MKTALLKYPFFLALDIEDPNKAWDFLKEHHLLIGGVKLGPKLILKAGWDFVTKAAKLSPVFLDFKFYDIPSVTVASVKNSFDLGASFVTVHAAVGAKTLSLLAKWQLEVNRIRPFKILPVSILTSFTEDEQLPHWQKGAIIEKVKMLAQLVNQSGLNALVCSCKELKDLKTTYPDCFFVTPGIRLSPNANANASTQCIDDQARVLTPLKALQAGSNALVIGRPIYKDANPKQALNSIILDCANAN